MNFWEQFAISMIKGILAGLHFDINKAATLKKVLMGIANDIYVLYDAVPPTPPTV
jgi:hypothetical protein